MKYLLVLWVIVMKNKLFFLTRMSLNKKIKTKWFLIANAIFAILIIGLINIDTIIKSFGGDFNESQEILVIDEANVFDEFKAGYESYSKYLDDYDEVVITKYEGSYDDGKRTVDDDKKILLIISFDQDNYLRAKIVSKESMGTITKTLITGSLNSLRSSLVLSDYQITYEMYEKINQPVDIETEVLSDNDTDNNLIISTIMEVITLPLFMLIMFLVQMIGAEVNEEKTTRSMEIIISNVSPKVHFLSKVISSNLFVIMQGLLLIVFVFMGVFIRYICSNGDLIGNLGPEVNQVVNSISLTGIGDTLGVMIPILLIMMALTFIAYSLLAGVLASMTTNLEDFQQLQTPIVVVSLAGFYLSMMAGVFKGSLFIKIMSYIPFISSLLAPTLYVLGEVSIIDLGISITLLILVIYLLIKYGLRVYKVGILNYSQTGLWKKIFRAIKEK